ncbi:unnamed protein product [Meganyctiphanes norvegica]|uniref:Transthyretin/hydroxyisourate hydrolase domain-containing protein n=1 Tax=Meganyctiphanes norvegica TaxID=48144 RepID=A0AAV2Q319_MEGNR
MNNSERIKVIQSHIAFANKNSTVRSMAAGNPITSHVLDTSSGQPASSLKMSLHRMEGEEWKKVSSKVTNADGRASGFLTQAQFTAGIYKMFFDTGDYYKEQSSKCFYPYVEV